VPFRTAHALSAINSINWARLLAQSVYYAWAYVQWLRATGWSAAASTAAAATAAPPQLPRLTFVVPTGNFGNALSGHYARAMGVPVDAIVVATNANDILHRFVSAGDYSLRAVTASLAPSMDQLGRG